MSIDPIELELMRNLFEAAAEEMGIVLQRVAFSANIKERRDFSCAIFTGAGQLVAQAAHIPVHLGSMPESVAAVLARLGALRDGDVAIVNDPFAGGTHLPDITIVFPVYVNGALVAYVANRAHHADVGGTSPGSMTLSRHIDEEGVRIEPSILDDRVMKRLLDAARSPDERRGDVEAQLAANRVGAGAVARIIRQRGIESFRFYARALLEYSASFMRRAIADIPDGEYRFQDVMDDDGAGHGPITIRAKVTIAGERATVDLSGSDDQAAGCINCPAAVSRSAVYYCFSCLLDESVPLNAGVFVDVITRPGTVVHATYPSAVVAGNTETSQRIVDVVLGALAQAIPHRIPAASCGTMSNIALGTAEISTLKSELQRHPLPNPLPEYRERESGAPSPGIPGEGRGEGSSESEISNLKSELQRHPLPNPLPEYRERESGAPSPGIPGEGGGEGSSESEISTLKSQLQRDPLLTPLPAYRERESGAWTYYETIGGGSGAGPRWDGESAVQCHMTNTLNTPAEALEMQYPLRVIRFERAAGTGGTGEFTGGDGIVREIEALQDCEGTILSDRRLSRPYGANGGGAASPGTNVVAERSIGGKQRFQLRRGERLRITTPGGGGFGPITPPAHAGR